ncbi:hypothetical protein [Amycolatopsis panacis]|uniref:hypothetical protein n=1 Tax=Amycolatopsis panacis TaxID=2340917 RepID=UPI0018F760BB|nr:hypothetical protein [Amycolatopsis panacis]
MNDQTPEPREGAGPAPASGPEEVIGSANEQTRELHSSAASAAEPAAAPGQGVQGQGAPGHGVPTPGVQGQGAPSPGAQGEGAPSPGAQGQAAPPPPPPPPPPQPPAGQQWGVPMPPPRPGGFRRFVGNRVTQLVAVGVLGLAVGGGVVGGVMAATYHPGHPTMSQHRGDHHFRGRAPIQRQGPGGQQNGGNGSGTGTGSGT